jgi:hypothetical protein
MSYFFSAGNASKVLASVEKRSESQAVAVFTDGSKAAFSLDIQKAHPYVQYATDPATGQSGFMTTFTDANGGLMPHVSIQSIYDKKAGKSFDWIIDERNQKARQDPY